MPILLRTITHPHPARRPALMSSASNRASILYERLDSERPYPSRNLSSCTGAINNRSGRLANANKVRNGSRQGTNQTPTRNKNMRKNLSVALTLLLLLAASPLLGACHTTAGAGE